MSRATPGPLAGRRQLFLALWVGWMALTFVLTSIPRPGFDVPVPLSDKLEHLAFYGVTGCFFALWRRASGASVARAAVQALLFATLAGCVDELHQYWIPGRHADPLDWLADTAGGGCGAFVSGFLSRRFPSLLSE